MIWLLWAISSELQAREIETWHQMLAQSGSLHRAFFTPAFAMACERAHGRAYVAVLHDASGIRAYLPFQFKSVWHQRIRLAERIGGDLSDAAGLIAWPDFRVEWQLSFDWPGLGRCLSAT